MYALLVIVHIIVSLTLIATVLLQAGKGGGLSDLAAGGGLQTAFGAEAGDVMKKATSVTAVVFMVTSLSLAFMSAQRGASVVGNIKPEQTPETAQQQQPPQKAGSVVKKKRIVVDPKTGKLTEVEAGTQEKSEMSEKLKGMVEKFGGKPAPEKEPVTEQQKTQTDPDIK